MKGSSGAFKNYYYQENKELPAYIVFRYEGAPTISDVPPDEMVLRFVDDKLFKITFFWGNHYDSDYSVFNANILRPAREALDESFGDRRTSGGSLRPDIRWVSPQYSIHETVDINSDNNLPSGYYLSYVQNELFREAKNIESSMK